VVSKLHLLVPFYRIEKHDTRNEQDTSGYTIIGIHPHGKTGTVSKSHIIKANKRTAMML